jgi:cysteinyl-tRNA synthetase
MSLKYLGECIDIHGGGQDLIFPHHENEITQSETYTGQVPFVRYWMHNGLLQLRGDKMSKSLGNLITVKDMLKQHNPDTIRLFVLNSHYRSPLLYSEESFAAAASGTERIRQAAKVSASDATGSTLINPQPFEQRFIESMDDDFNTAQAIAALFDLAREINRGRENKLNVVEARNKLVQMAMVLGFTLEEPERQPLAPEPLVELLIMIRNELRHT